MKNDKEIQQALTVNGRYVLHPKALVEPLKEEEKLSKSSIVGNYTFLWHYRLGHISLEEMIDLSNYGILHYGGDIQYYPFCKTYKEIKKTPSKTIKRQNDSFGDCLDVLHIADVGCMNANTYNREEYFITFIDGFSKFSCVYLLYNMS